MDELAEFWVHQVTVEPYEGEGAYGPIYGAPEQVSCLVERRRRLARTTDGDEVVSETTLYGPHDDAGKFPPESRVTLADGKVETVINSGALDGGPDLDLPDHMTVTLT